MTFQTHQVSSFRRSVVCYQKSFVSASTPSSRTGRILPRPSKPFQNRQSTIHLRKRKHSATQLTNLVLLQRPLALSYYSSLLQHHSITCFETLPLRNIHKLHSHNLNSASLRHLHLHSNPRQSAGVRHQLKLHSSLAQTNSGPRMHVP